MEIIRFFLWNEISYEPIKLPPLLRHSLLNFFNCACITIFFSSIHSDYEYEYRNETKPYTVWSIKFNFIWKNLFSFFIFAAAAAVLRHNEWSEDWLISKQSIFHITLQLLFHIIKILPWNRNNRPINQRNACMCVCTYV